MTHAVNLLPWRADRRRRERHRVLALIAGAPLLAVLVAGGIWLQLAAWQSAQEARNAHLERAIAEVEERLEEVSRLRKEREEIEARMAVLEGLVAQRGRPLVWLNAMVGATPDAITLARIAADKDSLELAGRARANGDVSVFMNRLEAAAIFEAPRLEVIEESEAGGYRFDLHLPLAEPAERAKDGTE
ncbi:PilN domain-containing protein [Thiohalospira sp.]|uniref:PilN domain-containing protein n=1 Tax=Thiohalospira sp. TaxID=3080549 RepID=UPI003980D452